MISKLRIFGFGFLIAIALGALAAPLAMTDDDKHTGGHFTNDAAGGDAALEVLESKFFPHTTRFFVAGMNPIKCTKVTYNGEMSDETQTSIRLFPEFKECWQGAHGAPGKENITISVNGCSYNFTIRETEVGKKDSPLHLECPAGQKIEVVSHGLCVTTVPPQEQTNAVTYLTRKQADKHEVTVRLTISKLKYEKHGLCAMVAPVGTGPHETGIEVKGAFIIKAFENPTTQVNLTATGVDEEEHEEEEEGEEEG